MIIGVGHIPTLITLKPVATNPSTIPFSIDLPLGLVSRPTITSLLSLSIILPNEIAIFFATSKLRSFPDIPRIPLKVKIKLLPSMIYRGLKSFMRLMDSLPIYI